MLLDPDLPVPAIVGASLSPLLIWLSLRLRRRQRLLADLPTSKADGVFIGLAELKGTAEAEAPLRSFLAEAACVHYAYEVQEHWSRTVTETYTDSKGQSRTRTRHESGWTTVAQGGETQAFYLRDETGVIRIQPQGAAIEPVTLFDETVPRGHALYYAKAPGHSVAHSDHRRRFVETGIPLHQPLFVVGQARERTDVVAAEIAKSPDAPLFLISTRTEQKVQRGAAGWSWFCWVLGLIAATAGVGILLAPLVPPPGSPVIGLAAFLVVWALGWTWMVFNSLVNLRQRVRQAWSQVDVQLKRRHDLIGPLSTIVAALGTHEQGTQTTLAALRVQLAATKPGVPGPDPAGVASELRVVRERYPTLVAHEGFTQLHRSLVETEQRIALARTYYNDIATHFRTRLEQIPDRWVAWLVRMQPEPLLAAENFERAPVQVALA